MNKLFYVSSQLEREGAGDENLSVTDLALVHGPKVRNISSLYACG